MIPAPRIRRWGLRDYQACAAAMHRRVAERHALSADEIWMLQHPQVLTLGAGADAAHIRPHCPLPIVRSRRGGQATCHAPGQLVVYTLLDLHRLHIGVRTLVRHLEDAALALLGEAGLEAHRTPGMPGVYVAGRKIASIGLHVSRGRSSHGMALNVAPDLSLFRHIDICGHPRLRATSLRACGIRWDVRKAADRLLPHLLHGIYGPPARA